MRTLTKALALVAALPASPLTASIICRPNYYTTENLLIDVRTDLLIKCPGGILRSEEQGVAAIIVAMLSRYTLSIFGLTIITNGHGIVIRRAHKVNLASMVLFGVRGIGILDLMRDDDVELNLNNTKVQGFRTGLRVDPPREQSSNHHVLIHGSHFRNNGIGIEALLGAIMIKQTLIYGHSVAGIQVLAALLLLGQSHVFNNDIGVMGFWLSDGLNNFLNPQDYEFEPSRKSPF